MLGLGIFPPRTTTRRPPLLLFGSSMMFVVTIHPHSCSKTPHGRLCCMRAFCLPPAGTYLNEAEGKGGRPAISFSHNKLAPSSSSCSLYPHLQSVFLS